MRSEMLTQILAELNGSSMDIEGSALISNDGLVIASVLSETLDDSQIGAMSAAILSLGDRTAEELARGALEQVLIKGGNGYILMAHAGLEAVLTVLAKPRTRLGLIFLDVRRAAEQARSLI